MLFVISVTVNGVSVMVTGTSLTSSQPIKWVPHDRYMQTRTWTNKQEKLTLPEDTPRHTNITYWDGTWQLFWVWFRKSKTPKRWVKIHSNWLRKLNVRNEPGKHWQPPAHWSNFTLFHSVFSCPALFSCSDQPSKHEKVMNSLKI